MISITPPTIARVSTFIIAYDGDSVTLKAPQLNDTKTQQLTRINRQTRGLTRRVFSSTDWYKAEIYQYTFTNLTLVKKNDLVDLLRTAAGDIVEITDHLSQEYDAFIVDIDVVEEVRNDECSYTIGLTLQETI